MNNAFAINPIPITFGIADTEAKISQAKQLCHDVYLDVGYIEAPYPNRIIPYELDSSSAYIIAMNPFREIIGTIRITIGGPSKTFEIWKGRLFPAYDELINNTLNSNSFEMGALAVKKDYSIMKISSGLYKAAFQYSLDMKLDYGIISMDARALRSLEMLGWFVIKIGAPMDYFGSLTVPGIMPVSLQPVAMLNNNILYHTHQAA